MSAASRGARDGVDAPAPYPQTWLTPGRGVGLALGFLTIALLAASQVAARRSR